MIGIAALDRAHTLVNKIRDEISISTIVLSFRRYRCLNLAAGVTRLTLSRIGKR